MPDARKQSGLLIGKDLEVFPGLSLDVLGMIQRT